MRNAYLQWIIPVSFKGDVFDEYVFCLVFILFWLIHSFIVYFTQNRHHNLIDAYTFHNAKEEETLKT